MEPIHRENTKPPENFRKKETAVAPRVSLPNRVQNQPAQDGNKNTPTDLPIAGLPLVPSDDMKWYTPPKTPSTQPPRPTAGPTTPRAPLAAPSIPHPELISASGLIPEKASFTGSRIPTTPPPLSNQSDELSPNRLVRVLPSRSVGSHRWETQSARYPEELLQIIESETREMQAIVTKDTPAVAAPKARKVKLRRKKSRVPELRQVTAVECGAACLAMVLNYYGYGTSISEVQERCGVGRDGLTALEVVKSARQYGLRVRTVSVGLEDFEYVTLPAIVHWEFNHFLIVERWTPSRVYVVDPAVGRRILTTEEFDDGFTGVAIMAEPGAQFEQRPQRKKLSMWSYMRTFLSMRSIILQIIGTSLLLQVLGLGGPLITSVVIDRIIPQKDPNMLMLLSLGLVIIIVMQGITGLLRSSLLIYLQTRIDTNMMLNFFEHLLSLPYRFFQLRLSGDLLARVSSNTAIRDLLTNQFISTLLDIGTLIVYAIALFAVSRLIGLVTLGIGFIQIILLLATAPALRRLTRRGLDAQGKTQGYMNEILAGIATLKAAGAEQRAFARWENYFYDEMNISLRMSFLSSIVGTILNIVNLLSPLALLWLGATLVIKGTMTVGTMLALNTLAAELLIPLTSLAASGQSLQIVRAHFDRVSDVIGTQPEQDPTEVRTPHRLRGQIELKRVGFRYDQNAPMILKDINVRIRPGQKIALVGKTGSGKSTLGKLLVGLITPTKGSILFDNVPLDTLNLQEVRSQFGVVLQESAIFSGSIKENIALNNPEMDMTRVIEAAQIAAIADDIEKMSMSYDTPVSEGGSAFSGGQRQRLSLARALANHPSILLLDEATSALDIITERTVEQNLNRLPCTQIIIAHRLSTIRNANIILVLDQGHIVEQGTHDQLVRKNGFYAQLIQAQLQNGEIAAL